MQEIFRIRPSLRHHKIQGNLYFVFTQKSKQMFLKGETMNFGTNKEKGNSGLGMAIYRVTI